MPNIGSEKVARRLPNHLITTHGDRGRKTLFLTFDDGPCPGVSERVGAMLEAMEVPASFFCIGTKIRAHPQIARELADRGHGVHNHSDTHRNYRRMSPAEQKHDMEACQDAIAGLAGNPPRIFRAPQGQLGLRSLLQFKRAGWHVVHWSYDSLDYQKPGVERLLERLRAAPPHGGDIMLFHDDNELCLHALKTLIPEWKAQGYSFSRVDKILA